MIGAKAQPTNTLLPVIQRHKDRVHPHRGAVRRIVHDTTPRPVEKRAASQYIDASGEEVFQPADLVISGFLDAQQQPPAASFRRGIRTIPQRAKERWEAT